MTCDQVRDLAPAFVLGALERHEEAEVRDHLATCAEPHPEFVELGEVVPALAASVELVDPPPSLRGRIMAIAAQDLAERQNAPPPILRRALAERVPMPSARPILARPRFTWALGIAAVLAIAALGAWNLSLRSELDGASAYSRAVGQVLAIAAEPGSLTAILSSRDDPNRAGLAAIGPDGSIHVVMRGLAPTTDGHVYEAWVIPGSSTPTPIGWFTVGSDGTGALTASGPGTAGVTVALTLEAGPGATTPTLPIVSSGVASPT